MGSNTMESLIEETVLDSSDYFYKYTYAVKICSIAMFLKADTPKVKQYINMKHVLDDDMGLSSFITIDLLEKLCSQPCVYYIQKGKKPRRFNMQYYGDYLEIVISGNRKSFDADEDLYKVYEWIEKTWKKAYKK